MIATWRTYLVRPSKPFSHRVLTVLVTRVHAIIERNIGLKPGSSETLSRLEGGYYVPTIGTNDTSATMAWYTPTSN